MSSFEEKQKKVDELLTYHILPDEYCVNEPLTAADIIKLYNQKIKGLLYYTDYYSNPTEKHKYLVHRGVTDLLTKIMTSIVGEFEITTKVSKLDEDEPDEPITKEELEKQDKHRIPLHKDMTVHTLINTEIDKYFYDEVYKENEVLSIMLSPTVYSQFALVKFVLRYIGFFDGLGKLQIILNLLKAFLETPLIYEVLFDDKIKEDIEQKLGWLKKDEVVEKYKKEAREYGYLPKENHTAKLNLYQVSSSSINDGFTKYPIIIAAADLQEAYDTFKIEFLDEKSNNSEYYARNIDAICKIGECLAVSDSAFETIKKELK